MRKVVLALIAVVALIAPVLLATPAEASSGEFVGNINGLRASKGLGALSTDGALNAQAQRWAQVMADAGKISHNPNLGATPGNWSKVGENVGVGGSVNSIFNALVNSPGHYKNMVEPNFNKIGVGVVVKDGRIYTCHVFASIPGAGGGSSNAGTRSSAPKPAAANPAPRASAGKAKAAPVARSTASSTAPTTPAAPAAETSTTEPVAPPAPMPSQRIVAGLAEVGAIATQG